VLEVSVEKDWHEPPPNLPVVLNPLAILPPKLCKGMRVRFEEGFVSNSVEAQRQDED